MLLSSIRRIQTVLIILLFYLKLMRGDIPSKAKPLKRKIKFYQPLILPQPKK